MGVKIMIVQSLQINEDLQLARLDPQQATEVLKDHDAKIWVDIQDFTPEGLEEWLDKLNITGLTRQLCVEARDHTGFYPLQKEILLVMPVLSGSGTPLEMDYLAILCRENLLFTIHQKPVLHLQQTDLFEGAEDWLPDASIAGLLSSILIDLSQACLQNTSELRRSIITMQERMDRDPETVGAEEILDIQSEVVALDTVVSDQFPPVEALGMSDKPFFNLKDSREYLNCAMVNLQAARGALSRLFDSVATLRSGFQMYAQDKTNRRLNMLTILSAIFMPMTFLAGIWGMNFELMPELKLVFGYPLGLGLMALIGSGMFFYFRKAGWFE
jgi:magnesium transporter